MKISHTWHPNTFGIMIGRTVKTACNKRRPVEEIVPPLVTTCRKCQNVVIVELSLCAELCQGAFDIVEAAGFKRSLQGLRDYGSAIARGFPRDSDHDDYDTLN